MLDCEPIDPSSLGCIIHGEAYPAVMSTLLMILFCLDLEVGRVDIVINFDIADDLVAAKFKCPKSCFEDKGDTEKTAEEIAKEKADFKAVEAEKTAAAKKAALEKAAAAKAAKEAEESA